MNSRRMFIKSAVVSIGAVTATAALSSNAFAEEKRRPKKSGGDALPLVEPGKGMAAGVKYAHTHADIKDASLKADRQGVKWDNQNCANCMLYTKIDDKLGKCTLFANLAVKNTGWCTSWAKKA